MPMPLSAMVIVPRVLVVADPDLQRALVLGQLGLRDSNSSRSLSMASEAFEISSRRKISLLLYSEWIIRSRIWTTSAWKLAEFSGAALSGAAFSCSVFSCSVFCG